MIGHNAFEPLWTAMEAATQARIDEAVSQESDRHINTLVWVALSGGVGWLLALVLLVYIAVR